jgi:hypothetical protein
LKKAGLPSLDLAQRNLNFIAVEMKYSNSVPYFVDLALPHLGKNRLLRHMPEHVVEGCRHRGGLKRAPNCADVLRTSAGPERASDQGDFRQSRRCSTPEAVPKRVANAPDKFQRSKTMRAIAAVEVAGPDMIADPLVGIVRPTRPDANCDWLSAPIKPFPGSIWR